jgi:mgtE-like transporter
MVTLPSLFLATFLLGFDMLTPTIAVLCTLLAAAAVVVTVRSTGLRILRRVVLESLPVLALAGAVDILAGMTIENRLDAFLAFPALLVLVPPFLEDSGSLGAILAARVSTKLHLGTLGEGRSPWRSAPQDVLLVYLYAVPVFVFLGVSSVIVSHLVNLASPGAAQMIGVSLLAGFMATSAAVIVGYYAAVTTFRLGLDPDNHSVPLVTSSLDLLGAFSLILAIAILGVT